MASFPAVIASIEKTKIALEFKDGAVLACEFVSGQMPRLGNKGVAVVDEAAMKVRFKGPRGATHLRIVA